MRPNKSTGISYNAQLQRLVRAIKNDIDRELIPLVKGLAPQYSEDSLIDLVRDGETFDVMTIRKLTKDGWVSDITNAIARVVNKWTGIEFDSLANQTAYQFVNNADSVNKRKFDSSMKSMGISVFSESSALDEMLQGAVYDNTQLIKSIPAQYLKQVESAILTNMRAGLRPSAIVKELQSQFGVTERRAKFIARDQTAKVNGDINKKRQTSAGFEYFQWLDSDDSRVRDRHEAIANKVTAYGRGIYRWDNPPLNDNGEQIIPGSDYNCRCVGIAVSQSQVDKNVKDGKVNKGVRR